MATADGDAHRRDAGVVREHEAAHAVVRGHVRRAARERDLDRGGPPRDEVGELALADAEQRLVDVGRVDVALDDVEDGDVARRLARRRRDHAVLGLQEAAHDVEDGRAPDGLRLGGRWRGRRRERRKERGGGAPCRCCRS